MTFQRFRLAVPVLSLLLLAGLATPAWSDDEPRSFPWGSSFSFGDCEGDDCPRAFFFARSGGFLGVELTNLNQGLREHFGVPRDAGVLIAKVVEDSPAEAAGLRVGDIITSIDGETVGSSGDLARAIRDIEDSREVEIDAYRDGDLITVRADIEVRERSTIDIGELIGRHGVEISDALSSIDWQEIAESTQHVNEEALRSAFSSIEHKFSGEQLDRFMEHMENFDYQGYEERMQQLRERMEELEQRLEERFRDNGDDR